MCHHYLLHCPHSQDSSSQSNNNNNNIRWRWRLSHLRPLKKKGEGLPGRALVSSSSPWAFGCILPPAIVWPFSSLSLPTYHTWNIACFLLMYIHTHKTRQMDQFLNRQGLGQDRQTSPGKEKGAIWVGSLGTGVLVTGSRPQEEGEEEDIFTTSLLLSLQTWTQTFSSILSLYYVSLFHVCLLSKSSLHLGRRGRHTGQADDTITSSYAHSPPPLLCGIWIVGQGGSDGRGLGDDRRRPGLPHQKRQ